MSFLRGISLNRFLRSLLVASNDLLEFLSADSDPRAVRTLESKDHIELAWMNEPDQICLDIELSLAGLKHREGRLE